MAGKSGWRLRSPDPDKKKGTPVVLKNILKLLEVWRRACGDC
jgi:hypothetical protein